MKHSLRKLGNRSFPGSGKIVIVTGKAGSGKDYLIDKVLGTGNSGKKKVTKVVSHTTRPKRESEIHGVHYYFVGEEEFMQMKTDGEFAEEPVKFGRWYKATSKTELLKITQGIVVIWRIDPSLFSKIIQGKFYNNHFPESISEFLIRRTTTVLIDADKTTLQERRKLRDKENYDDKLYEERDIHDSGIIENIKEKIDHIIVNEEGSLKESSEKLIAILNEK